MLIKILRKVYFAMFFKKRLVMTVTLIIAIIAILYSSISAYAAQPELIADAPADVAVGRSFDVNFSSDFNKLQDISAIEIKLYFDKNNLSVKGTSTNNGEIKFYDSGGCVTVIALFENGITENSPIFTVTFTAKSGQDNSSQHITAEFIQAVNSSLNDVDFSITEKLNINITRTSSSQSEKNTTQNSKSGPTSRSANSKSSGTSSNSSRKNSSGSITDSTEKNSDYENTTSSFEDDLERNYGSLPSVGNLNGDSNSVKYMIIGGVLSFCIISVILIAYRIGKISAENKINEEKKKEERQEN